MNIHQDQDSTQFFHEWSIRLISKLKNLLSNKINTKEELFELIVK